jgi:O-antigen/teichoic acid export membrane protein
MKRMRVRRVLNAVAIVAVIAGFALLGWANIVWPPSDEPGPPTYAVWGLWAAIAVGYVVRMVLILTKKRPATKDPVVSAGDVMQDLYLGRTSTPAPQRRPDEYSAHGAAPAWSNEHTERPDA